MILSYSHGFAFIKTIKTASTSVEVFLSRYAGPADVLTYLPPPDEALRRAAGLPGPQNCFNPAWKQFLLRLRGIRRHDARYSIDHNIRATDLRRLVGGSVWDGLATFTVVRNPYDRAISKFFNDHKHEAISRLYHRRPHTTEAINAYIRALPDTDLTNWHLYTEADRIIVSDVLNYESLSTDLGRLLQKLGINDRVELPRAKATWRLDRRHYSEILEPRTRERIATAARREIEAFGFSWDEVPRS